MPFEKVIALDIYKLQSKESHHNSTTLCQNLMQYSTHESLCICTSLRGPFEEQQVNTHS